MYKVGDEVLVKGAITDLHEGTDHPYFVAVNYDSVHWVSEDKFIPMDKTYADGLSDAWELAKKIHHAPCDGGYSADEVRIIFGCCNGIMHKFTAEEALAKIEAYEKEKEIKVGDVVRYGIGEDIGKYAIVMRIEGNEFYTMYADGSYGRETHTEDFKKTGKHIDIESLLRHIGE